MIEPADPEGTSLLINKMGGRTFLLTLGCGIVTSVLTWFGKIDGSTYALVITGTVGAYITANAYRGVKSDAAAKE